MAYFFLFFYLGHIFFYRCLQNCSPYTLVKFGRIGRIFWTYFDVKCKQENRDFRFDDPTLTACNLTHGPDTITKPKLFPSQDPTL